MVTIKVQNLINFVAEVFPIRVPLPDGTRAAIVNTAREVGISKISIRRATA
jgi:hypothetical protein